MTTTVAKKKAENMKLSSLGSEYSSQCEIMANEGRRGGSKTEWLVSGAESAKMS
jgi:hypothetical protein